MCVCVCVAAGLKDAGTKVAVLLKLKEADAPVDPSVKLDEFGKPMQFQFEKDPNSSDFLRKSLANFRRSSTDAPAALAAANEVKADEDEDEFEEVEEDDEEVQLVCLSFHFCYSVLF